MIEYRLFLMQDAHILSAAEFVADGDDAALAHAKTLCGGRDAELWSRARQVELLPAEPRPAVPAFLPAPATALPIAANAPPGERRRA